MEKQTLLESLKVAAEQEDALLVSREISEMRSRFEDLMIEEDRLFQIKQLEAKENGETPEEAQEDPIRSEFYTLLNEYKERKATAVRHKKEAEEANLRRKKALIDRLKELISSEENIGAAISSYKEIHESWKLVGDIPREKRQDIQSEYSRLLETFFYHMKIYRELREHDLKRNYQLKLDVVKRIQALENVQQLKDVEQSLKALQNEWEETGPVGNEEWESLKTNYWEAVRAIYVRIQASYDERRTEQSTNIEAKKALAQKAADLITNLPTTSTKEWEEATKTVLAFQEEWKTIGFGPRKENEEIWKAFRASCDSFFAAKKVYFDSIRGQFDEIAQKKQALIDRVQALKDSTDWKNTTEKIVLAQRQWKELGNAGQRMEQKLWKDFRGVCDSFFNAKQAHFSAQDQALEGNLTAKLELIERIKLAEVPADKKSALTFLKELAAEFTAIGFVPMKQKDAIYAAYREAMNGHYDKLKLEAHEKDTMQFQARLENLKASPNADRAIERERTDLKEKMNQLKSDILQYENNLGFFAKSKGADALRKEVDIKVAAAKEKIADLQAKLKQI